MSQTKSFNITKRQVWEAYKKVKANKGSAGVDGVYKLRNFIIYIMLTHNLSHANS